ncbi:hypothetical protein DFA_09577 [Cavenderia fasciculata]|uniref:Uncharacterized protein n=1 Tax=Cavenderia fasciculata TaxID=261658 RepID=F4Q808_CACFS|nr:uncharacterized protein DFA_09577 [Cavenderia fasciculata]EGG15908.1 hypothetical protein DFA_09577 [Cavenderia fasciculata]|eukprot:XP_004352233.1 hypothetical protein DFA_09577 [Cavenderia fasciculata]
MENIIKINWNLLSDEKEVRSRIVDWFSKSDQIDELTSFQDLDQQQDNKQKTILSASGSRILKSEVTRMDVYHLMEAHNIKPLGIHSDPQMGIYMIEFQVKAKEFYGIASNFHLTFSFSEAGYLIHMDVKRNYDNPSSTFYDTFIKKENSSSQLIN